VHKIGLVLKELKETRYWLRLAAHVPLVRPQSLRPLLSELEELIAIFGKSVKTARRRLSSMPSARCPVPGAQCCRVSRSLIAPSHAS